FFNQANRLALAHHAGALLAQAALESAMPPVNLQIFLPPRQLHLRGVDDHDVVARVDKGRVDRLVLALQQLGRKGSHSTEDLSVGINDVPPAVCALRACQKRTHETGTPRGWV